MLVCLIAIISGTLGVLLVIGVISKFAELESRISAHPVAIIGLTAFGMSSALLVGIATHYSQIFEVEGLWPAPGSEDTELGVFMGPEVSHGATTVYTRVQA
jgi:hypothetical protein